MATYHFFFNHMDNSYNSHFEEWNRNASEINETDDLCYYVRAEIEDISQYPNITRIYFDPENLKIVDKSAEFKEYFGYSSKEELKSQFIRAIQNAEDYPQVQMDWIVDETKKYFGEAFVDSIVLNGEVTAEVQNQMDQKMAGFSIVNPTVAEDTEVNPS